MKTLTLVVLLAGLVIFPATRSMAVVANPSETIFNGKVINSTFTFTGVGVSGPGNFSLDQTTISNLNSLIPPVTLQLILQDITYTEASVTGDGLTPTVTFDLAPTLGNAGGNLPSTQVTLTAPGPIANGVVEDNVVFSLLSPVVFAPVDETNPGNTNGGSGTWQESLSNLEPTPDSITTTNGVFVPGSVQNQNFSFNGTVEVVYATPEPSSWLLGLIASAIFVGLCRRKRALS